VAVHERTAETTKARRRSSEHLRAATVPLRGRLAMGNKFSKQIERAKVTNELDIRYAG